MKFTLSWLKKFLDTEASLDEISYALTDLGLEVEEIIDRSAELAPFTVAEILEAAPHPNADKLRICRVATDEGEMQIVCGAPNARAGIKVILAKVGTLIPNGQFQIKAAEIRGIKSNGMLCSEDELLIGIGSDGIAELPMEAKIGESFAKYYGLDDPMIEIAVTPNRADCLGVYGIARDLAARGIGELHRDNSEPHVPNNLNQISASHSAPNNDSCFAFATVEITGLTNQESPQWLQLLLKNIGKTPISAVVDITNYICNTFSRPLHAYDKDKLSGVLEVTYAKNGEKFQALNNKEYELTESDLVVSAGGKAEALAGIIGGMLSSCKLDTKNIVLESAIFDPIAIAKTGRRLHIDTDSRHRGERGLDKGFVARGLQIAAQMIAEICGGKVGAIKITGDLTPKPREIDFDIATLKHRTGLELNAAEIMNVLERLKFVVTKKSEGVLSLKIPSHRLDVSIKEDITEEIARLHGYDKIPSQALPERAVSRVLSTLQRRERDAKRIFASLGYDELITWSFMNSNKAAEFTELKQSLRLQNPISQELNYMRPSIIPNLLEAMAKNLARSIHDLAFFEVGPVFFLEVDHSEKSCISGVKCGAMYDKNPHASVRNVDVFDVKADADTLLSEMGLGLDRCQVTNDAPSYYHPTRSARISLGKTTLGYFGEIHPDILESYDIKKRVIAFEIDLEAVPEGKLKYGNKGGFVVVDYQPVGRDFAFVVDQDKPAGDMLKLIQNIDKKLIKNVILFDLYEGDKLEAGKKSLAFNVMIQADDRTLTEDEINKLSGEIISAASSKFGAVLRG